MKTQILEKLNELKQRSGKSFENVHDSLGFATSTVHRWHKGESTPDIDDLTALVEFYGGSMEDLFAAVGKQEMTATQSIGYQGADVMVEHYEARLAAKDEKYNLLQAHHEQRIEEINGNHGRAVEYLKEDIKRLRKERDDYRSECEALKVSSAEEIARAHKAASDVTGKKHAVYWVSTGLNVLLAIAVIIALLTDSII